MMTSAMEGGCGYWIDSISPGYTKHEDYSTAEAYGPDMVARTFTAEDDDGSYLLNHDAILSGLQTMATNYPRHFNDLMDDNDDADTADVFLQLCLMKEIVYG